MICVEHDLAVLDYLSDFICCLYGKPGAYGVVTLPFSVREGINIFLAGFVPTENLRFREEALTFRVSPGCDRFPQPTSPEPWSAETKTSASQQTQARLACSLASESMCVSPLRWERVSLRSPTPALNKQFLRFCPAAACLWMFCVSAGNKALSVSSSQEAGCKHPKALIDEASLIMILWLATGRRAGGGDAGRRQEVCPVQLPQDDKNTGMAQIQYASQAGGWVISE